MKRAFDICLSLLGLILFSPVFVVVGVLIATLDGLPIFFRQERIGFQGRTFRIWKFRTMVRNAEKLGNPLTVGRDTRITRCGYWLRQTKLDELPQLINVLLGEMSFVGPRPEVAKYVRHYKGEQTRVLELVPGITDAASIKYRHENELLAGREHPEQTYINEIIPEKIRLNLEYARQANVWRDCLVIFRTLTCLLKSS